MSQLHRVDISNIEQSLFITFKFWINYCVNLLNFTLYAKPAEPTTAFLLTVEKWNLSISKKNLISQRKHSIEGL